MEAAESSSTYSKVIVQCTDPYDLFDKIYPGLETRLPLGNLHWKSPTRPLRSIDKLNVSFVREAKLADLVTPTRRHQIPGLRQTPYVKVFLLRCDDREIYKESVRKEVREWLKKQGVVQDTKPTNKGQERHDAFEHLIVHVVLPGTAAAAQPRSNKFVATEASDSTDSLNNRSKWVGKNASTVYDKLQSDFNPSSKGQLERVAQIRITDPVTRTTSGSPSEIEELWQDFVEKLKAAILRSFDARVLQYEEDIRDRENQRLLPGWNFCTFFILKEGLARGFENVGLIEDSLTVYDELDAGLDKVVQEQALQGDTDSAGALLPFSQDLKPAIRKALDALEHEIALPENIPSTFDLDALIEVEKSSFPLDTNKIDYQHRILTNQVSALDLRLYMYTRKLRLLFRRARNLGSSGRSKLGGPQYDVGKISEICAQALEFINFASRALRRDLYAAWGGREGLGEQELETQALVIDNLVASWKISAILQILDECQVSYILADKLTSPLESPSPHRRTLSSVSHQSQRSAAAVRPSSSGKGIVLSPLDRRQSSVISLHPSPQPQREAPHFDSRERLALWTAELFVALRDIIKLVCPGVITVSQPGLSNGTHNFQANGAKSAQSGSGIISASLRAVHASPAACTALYKMLTVYSYRCYEFANQIQASRQMILDLAQMELMDGSSQNAVSWIEQIPDMLDIEAKTITDLSLFRFYSQCLDKDEVPDKYVRCLLSIMQFAIGSMGGLALSRTGILLQEILDEIVEVSPKTESYDLPLEFLFDMNSVKDSIGHYPDQDGFFVTLTMSLRHRLNLRSTDEMILTLACVDGGDAQIISLNAKSPGLLDSAQTKFEFTSKTTTTGWYEPDHLQIRIGNLRFIQYFRKVSEANGSTRQVTHRTCSRMLVYPRAGSFSIQARSSNKADLTQPARIALLIETHDNDIKECLIRLKPATGGFRLAVASALLEDEEPGSRLDMIIEEKNHTLRVTGLTKARSQLLEIPYTLENGALTAVQLKIETTYSLGADNFKAYFEQRIDIGLSITVNVQDIFQPAALFLRFTAGPAEKTPVRILRWDLQAAGQLKLGRSRTQPGAVSAFSRLPASWVVRVERDRHGLHHQEKVQLTVAYQCIREAGLYAVMSNFKAALEQSTIARASTLLASHLASELPKLWTANLLEMFALLQETEVATFEDLQWHHALRALSPADRGEVEDWLRSWHAACPRVPLAPGGMPPRTLKLLVDIPRPSILVSTRITVDDDNESRSYELGKPIAARLLISCDQHVDIAMDVHYDITAAPEVWLVAGKKRGHFHSRTDACRIPIILIPQKTGHLLKPTVEVRCRQPEADAPSANLTVEVEHRSQAQTLQVVPSVRTITLALGHGQKLGLGDYGVVHRAFRGPPPSPEVLKNSPGG